MTKTRNLYYPIRYNKCTNIFELKLFNIQITSFACYFTIFEIKWVD